MDPTSSVPPPRNRSETAVPDPPAVRERSDDEPPWGVATVLAALAAGFGAFIALSVVIAIAAGANGSSTAHLSPVANLVLNVVFDLVFVGAAVYFAVLHSHPQAADFGFRTVRWRRGIGGFVAGGLSYYILTALYASLFRLHGKDKLPSELGVNKSTAALVIATVFVCVIAPMAEEFIFRGFIFGALRRWRMVIAGRNFGTWVAAVVTGILFGLVHAGSASPQYLIPLGFLGFVLCLIRWWTRSLYPCIALHSFNNSLALGINQLHWNVGEILALMVGSIAMIALVTGPLASPRAAVP
jgi:membrane protease YdiL (CAAX protease family)